LESKPRSFLFYLASHFGDSLGLWIKVPLHGHVFVPTWLPAAEKSEISAATPFWFQSQPFQDGPIFLKPREGWVFEVTNPPICAESFSDLPAAMQRFLLDLAQQFATEELCRGAQEKELAVRDREGQADFTLLEEEEKSETPAEKSERTRKFIEQRRKQRAGRSPQEITKKVDSKTTTPESNLSDTQSGKNSKLGMAFLLKLSDKLSGAVLGMDIFPWFATELTTLLKADSVVLFKALVQQSGSVEVLASNSKNFKVSQVILGGEDAGVARAIKANGLCSLKKESHTLTYVPIQDTQGRLIGIFQIERDLIKPDLSDAQLGLLRQAGEAAVSLLDFGSPNREKSKAG
jgi:hypothetical protein